MNRVRDAADGAVESWIESVSAAQNPPPALDPRRDQLHYVLQVQEQFYVPRMKLLAHMIPSERSGGRAAARAFDLAHIATGSAKHVTPTDRTIGRLVNASGLLGGLGAVSATVLGTLLEALIESGRLHWHDLDLPVLRREAVEKAQLAWRTDDDGRQRLHVADRLATTLLPSTPLWYVDEERYTAGPLDIDIPASVGPLLATVPSLTDDQARRVNLALRHVFAGYGIAPPHAENLPDVIDRDPTPVVRVTSNHGAVRADLAFAYGEHVVTQRDSDAEFFIEGAGAPLVWPRRRAFEAQSSARLEDFGIGATADDKKWVRFLAFTAPQLRAQGWRVDVDEDVPFVVHETAEEGWTADLTETQARWFELDLGIDVNGERVQLLPLLVDALPQNGITFNDDLTALAERKEPIYAQLPNGSYVALPPARVARVLATLIDLFGDPRALRADGRLQISRTQSGAIADLERSMRVHGGTALRNLIDALTVTSGDDLATPEGFHATLRPYQRDGVAWLQTLRTHGFGGTLADDMGLGKTVQLLAHVAIEKAAGRLSKPVLIVAPTSVVPNWRAEINRFVPSMRVLSLTGADRASHLDEVSGSDIVLTTYALLSRDAEVLHRYDWSIAVLDEAQAIKNARTKAALSARKLRADQRIAMTGTPIENHLDELWSIFAFSEPGLLRDQTSFRRAFRNPIEKGGDTLRRSALAGRLRPFLLRRTKELVASDLPPKTEIVQRVELAGEQRDLYETIRLAMHERVRSEVARLGLARSRIVVLDALLKLRQICCDPRLLGMQAAKSVKESQKLDALLEMLQSLIEDGRRILLFSQFTSMLDLIAPELRKLGIDFVELRGDTRDRETPVARFQNKEVPLFLISLKAGGTGLNLTAADTVIHYDPWWNPAVERQATDRAHRIGQEQHVFIYKLIAEGTVEERILELQERKGALATSLFEETSNAPLRLDLNDIDGLFG